MSLLVIALLVQSCLGLDDGIGVPLTREEFDEARKMSFRDGPGPMETIIGANAKAKEKAIREGRPFRQLRGDIVQRNEVTCKAWPNTTIPYIVDNVFNQEERWILGACFVMFQDIVNINLVPRTDQVDYIYIFKGDGCFADLGNVGGSQKLSLGDGCVDIGTCVHEVMHALGVDHEQSRPDRDQYVKINYENVTPGFEHSFYIAKGSKMFGDYDFCSVMHYALDDFSKNDEPTIEVLEGVSTQGCIPGASNTFSQADVYGLKQMYDIE